MKKIIFVVLLVGILFGCENSEIDGDPTQNLDDFREEDSSEVSQNCVSGYRQLCLDGKLYRYIAGDDVSIYELVSARGNYDFQDIEILLGQTIMFKNPNEDNIVFVMEERVLTDEDLNLNLELVESLYSTGFVFVRCNSKDYENESYACWNGKGYKKIATDNQYTILEKRSSILAVNDVLVTLYADEDYIIYDYSGGQNNFLVQYNDEIFSLQEICKLLPIEILIDLNGKFPYLFTIIEK